jgi:hypothetical protein
MGSYQFDLNTSIPGVKGADFDEKPVLSPFK